MVGQQITDWCPCGPSPVPPICSLSGRFLRDYDALFPVADDVSLLQQASSVLYPSIADAGRGPGLSRSAMDFGTQSSTEKFTPEHAGQPAFPRYLDPCQGSSPFLVEIMSLVLRTGEAQSCFL